MKLKYVIIGIIVIVIGICCYLLFGRDKIKVEELETSNIKSFYLGYDAGFMMNSNTSYKISLENDKYIAIIKPYGVSDDEELFTEVSSKVMEKISDVLKKYKVNKWDGFNKSDNNVMDGNGFNLNVQLLDGTTINASGYMMWPNNYSEVKNEINEIFMEVYNKGKEN